MRIASAFVAILLGIAFQPSIAAEPEATITVRADRVVHAISPYTTGACIEDVNHEIYGGIYSQMVFGESFAEPAPAVAPAGFVAHGGTWDVTDDGVLKAAAGEGPKLLVDRPAAVDDGEVGVEMRFTGDRPGLAGLITK